MLSCDEETRRVRAQVDELAERLAELFDVGPDRSPPSFVAYVEDDRDRVWANTGGLWRIVTPVTNADRELAACSKTWPDAWEVAGPLRPMIAAGTLSAPAAGWRPDRPAVTDLDAGCPRTAADVWEGRRAAGEVDYPHLDGYPDTYEGVSVMILAEDGEDGDHVVLFGHQDPGTALGTLHAHCRKIFDESVFTHMNVHSVSELLVAFEHRWGRVKTHCDKYPGCAGPDPLRDGENRPATPLEDGDPEFCYECDEIATHGWVVDTGAGNTPDMPGAFPATVLVL